MYYNVAVLFAAILNTTDLESKFVGLLPVSGCDGDGML